MCVCVCVFVKNTQVVLRSKLWPQSTQKVTIILKRMKVYTFKQHIAGLQKLIQLKKLDIRNEIQSQIMT